MTFEPLTLGAGAGVIGLLFTLSYVLLKYVTSQGGSWQTLVHEAQADAAKARAEVALVRLELVGERAVLTEVRDENRDLHKQIRGQSPPLGGGSPGVST